MRRDTKGLNLESYAGRIATLREPDNERNKKQIVQKKLQVSNTEMKMTSVNKVQFASLNDKRFYFCIVLCLYPTDIPYCQKCAR